MLLTLGEHALDGDYEVAANNVWACAQQNPRGVYIKEEKRRAFRAPVDSGEK